MKTITLLACVLLLSVPLEVRAQFAIPCGMTVSATNLSVPLVFRVSNTGDCPARILAFNSAGTQILDITVPAMLASEVNSSDTATSFSASALALPGGGGQAFLTVTPLVQNEDFGAQFWARKGNDIFNANLGDVVVWDGNVRVLPPPHPGGVPGGVIVQTTNPNNGNDGLVLNDFQGVQQASVTWGDASGQNLLILSTGQAAAITANLNQHVGIGPSTYPDPLHTLFVTGSAFATGGFQSPSDVRLKTNIAPITNALKKISQLHGVSFDWNAEAASLGDFSDRRQTGLIAQDVERVFPDLVTTWGPEHYLAVDYARMAAVLVEAAKELREENVTLKGEVEILQAKTDALERRLASLEKLIRKDQSSK